MSSALPVFVLTHHARAPIEMAGGTVFHFATEGIEAALERAVAAAGGLDGRLGGGIAMVRQYLQAVLVDEMHLAVRPVLLGAGEHLMAGIDLHALGYECVSRVVGERATHFWLIWRPARPSRSSAPHRARRDGRRASEDTTRTSRRTWYVLGRIRHERGCEGKRMIVRRRFLAIVVSGFLAPAGAVSAQLTGKTHRVGWLRVGHPPPGFIEPFRQGLRELGYVEGHSIVIEYGLAEHVAQLPEFAARLVRLRVDVLVASGTPSVVPAKKATDTVPVVFVAAIDPVAAGVVASLARPGGNVTGVSAVHADAMGKRLQLLKELLPKASRISLLVRAGSPATAQYVKEAENGARALGIQLQVLSVLDPADLDGAFASARDASALLLVDDAMLTAQRERIAQLALRNRLPTISGLSEAVEAGGLMSFGPHYGDLYRLAATQVHKILKGTKPADLPVEQPTKFELVINVKTARALGVTIPQSIRARADAVIE